MNSYKLDDMIKGWFVGDFDPCALRTDGFEVAVKRYRAGDSEAKHVHRIATEITLILGGAVRMCEREWGDGDIVVLAPGDATAFEALTDVTTVVVKTPSAPNDKYPA